MYTLQQLASMLDLCQLGLTGIFFLHALSVFPQWRAQYFNARYLRITIRGLLLGLAQGAVIVAAVEHSAVLQGGSIALLAASLLMHAWIAVQNLAASYAFVRLDQRCALLAHKMHWAIRPLGYISAALTGIAWLSLA